MNIKIISDSTCDLSAQQVREHNISIKPLIVNMGDKSYRDGVDITPQMIYDYVAKEGTLCTTSAIPVGEYEEYFALLGKDADAVIHICLGSGFSSCYQNACLAAEELENVYVNMDRIISSPLPFPIF